MTIFYYRRFKYCFDFIASVRFLSSTSKFTFSDLFELLKQFSPLKIVNKAPALTTFDIVQELALIVLFKHLNLTQNCYN